MKWVPAYFRIQGNKEADRAARSGFRQLPSKDSQLGFVALAYVRRLMNRKRQALLDDWWEEVCPPRYRNLGLLMQRRKPREQALSRRLLREQISARTDHGNFATCHRPFNGVCVWRGNITSPLHSLSTACTPDASNSRDTVITTLLTSLSGLSASRALQNLRRNPAVSEAHLRIRLQLSAETALTRS